MSGWVCAVLSLSLFFDWYEVWNLMPVPVIRIQSRSELFSNYRDEKMPRGSLGWWKWVDRRENRLADRMKQLHWKKPGGGAKSEILTPLWKQTRSWCLEQLCDLSVCSLGGRWRLLIHLIFRFVHLQMQNETLSLAFENRDNTESSSRFPV